MRNKSSTTMGEYKQCQNERGNGRLTNERGNVLPSNVLSTNKRVNDVLLLPAPNNVKSVCINKYVYNGGTKMSKRISDVITLGEYAERHGLDVKRLRRLARKSEFPGDVAPFKWGGKNGLWAIDATAPVVELPDKSARGNRRDDGRQRYVFYGTPMEHGAVTDIVGVDNVINPRVAAKQRRDARKLAELENDVVE